MLFKEKPDTDDDFISLILSLNSLSLILRSVLEASFKLVLFFGALSSLFNEFLKKVLLIINFFFLH